MAQDTFDFNKLQAQMGLETQEPALVDKPIVNPEDLAKLNSIQNSSEKQKLDLSKARPEEKEPEYLEQYKEVLSKKLEVPADNKNYTTEAIDKFGPEYARLINNKESFTEELYTRQYKDEYIGKFDKDQVASVKKMVDGLVDKAQVVRDRIKSNLEKNDLYTEELYDKISSKFFGEDGELNKEGLNKFNEHLNQAKQIYSSLQTDAQRYAAEEYKKYKELMTTVSHNLKETTIGGVKLPEELSSYLEHLIVSGKTNEWIDNTPTNLQDAAMKEIKIALISDDNAFAHWFKMVTELGVNFGVSTKAKQIFN